MTQSDLDEAIFDLKDAIEQLFEKAKDAINFV